MRRSQATIFIIFGLFFLIVIGIFLYVFSMGHNADPESDIFMDQKSDLSNIDNIAKSCFDSVSKDGMRLFGVMGGMIYNGNYFSNIAQKVHYSFYGGRNNVVSIEEGERQLEEYVLKNFNDCVNSTFLSTHIGGDIHLDEPDVDVSINEFTVSFTLEPKVTYKSEEETRQIERMNKVYDIRLKYILELVDEIIETVRIREEIPLASVNNIKGISATSWKASEGTVIYEISDNESKLITDDYIFMFAIDISQNFSDTTLAPVVDPLFSFIVNAGDRFRLKLNAYDPEGESLKYDAVTTLFEVSSGGMIDFIVDETMIGKHSIPIFVEDESGGVSVSYLELDIK